MRNVIDKILIRYTKTTDGLAALFFIRIKYWRVVIQEISEISQSHA